MTEQPEEKSQEPQIMIEPQIIAGVWANFARVSHSPYEFTLDFVRMDFNSSPSSGIVVARVSLSPLLVSQLIDALNSNWQSYAQKSMPPEVRQHEPPPDPDGDRPEAADPAT